MHYVIRFEIAPQQIAEKGATHTYVRHLNGKTALGVHPDTVTDGRYRCDPIPLTEATFFDSYEAAARVLLAWAMTATAEGMRWALNPQIVEFGE